MRWLSPPELSGWECLRVRESRHLWTLYHECYALIALAKPGVCWYYRGHVYAPHSTGTMLLEPHEVHRTLSCPPNMEFTAVFIPCAAVLAAAQANGSAPNLELAEAYTGELRLTHAVWTFGELIEQGAGASQIQDAQAEILRDLLERRMSAAGRTAAADGVAVAAEYLRARFNAPVQLKELAAASRMSSYGLVRAFGRRFGVPPHAFQIHVRIARARELLRKGVPARLVATEVGFCDQSHFNRHFRRVMGTTPGAYAHRARAYTSRAVEPV